MVAVFLETVCWCAPSRLLIIGTVLRTTAATAPHSFPNCDLYQKSINKAYATFLARTLCTCLKLLTLLHPIRRLRIQSPLFVSFQMNRQGPVAGPKPPSVQELRVVFSFCIFYLFLSSFSSHLSRLIVPFYSSLLLPGV